MQDEILEELAGETRGIEDVDWEKAGELVNYSLTNLL
jgi:hypothetical protein